MRAVIVGLGSIGQRHLKNLRQIAPEAEIAVWHQHSRPGDRPAPSEADRVVYTLDAALDPFPDFAVIANPAPMHIETAWQFAEQGIDLMIEKPLAASMDGVENLLTLCRERGAICMVAYVFRFYEPLRLAKAVISGGQIGRVLSFNAEVGQYLPDWRPGRDYRETVSAKRALGGGAVLELSHEIDLARWLVGEVETVSAQMGKLSDLEIDVEDVAEVTLRFESGAIGRVHVDMVQRSPVRGLRVVGTEGTLTWDWQSHRVRVYTEESEMWRDLHPAVEMDRNGMYITELEHFLDCVTHRTVPVIGGEDGRRVLEIALAAKQSAVEQRVITL
ncbi:MAG: Gfo/Idh/MocA family oxidoreductase [Anaerolineae bacterium]|nr:Gfo/Idh/MocA family oxidoreductase [Anaerolineae bacterium]